MNIDKYYEEWNNLPIDNYRKQILVDLFSKKLGNMGCIELILSKNIEDYFKKVLKNKNKNINNLTNLDMHKLIVDLNSSIKLSENQLDKVRHHFPEIKLVNEYLKKNSQKYIKLVEKKKFNELRLIDYNLLINENPNVNFEKCLEKIPKIKEVVLKYTSDYEHGYQINENFNENKMYYLKFYDMLMIDYDNKNIEELHKLLDKYDFAYKIYETTNGYHVYVTSHKISYNEDNSTKILLNLNCDKRYIIFSKYNGYNIRLSKKKNEEKFNYKFVEDYGKGVSNGELLGLIDILDFFVRENSG